MPLSPSASTGPRVSNVILSRIPSTTATFTSRTSRCAASVGCGSAIRLATGFSAPSKHGVDTNNRIFCRQLFVGHLNRSISMQHGLKSIDRLKPGEILDIAERFRDVPSDHHAIGQFLYVMRSGHSRLEEDTNCRSAINQSAGCFRQRLEAVNRNASLMRHAGRPFIGFRISKSNRPGAAHMERSPTLTGEGKRELMECDIGALKPCAVIRIPLQGAALDPISGTLRRKPQRMASEVEEIGLP